MFCDRRSHAVSAICFATCIISSLGLQNQLASKNLQSQEDGWTELLEAFRNDEIYSREVCTTREYDAYFHGLPPLSMANLKIPPNTKILFYGTSFLHEVVENVVAANEPILVKGPLGGFEGFVLDRDNETDWMLGWLSQWNFTVNSTIVEVQNYWKLQFPENVENLRLFLQEHKFDVAVFMNPHPSCHFNRDPPAPSGSYCECFQECHRRDHCAWIHDCNEKNFDVGPGCLRGPRFDIDPLWDVMKHTMQGNVYEVEAWTKEQRTSFHADEDHTIRTYPILANNPCNQHDNCTGTEGPGLYGHQCQPGLTTSVAELVMLKVASAVTASAATPEWCGQGIKVEDVCCDAECGTCGGAGCFLRPGGKSKCCKQTITESAKPCEDFGDVACVIPATTPPMPAQ